MKLFCLILPLLFACNIHAQDYFYSNYAPFDTTIISPQKYLGYKIGDFHTRHDQVISYFKKLSELSPYATYIEYGKTFEGRPLCMLIISNPENLQNLENIRKQHLGLMVKYDDKLASELPAIVNLGYNVHGNEPSSTEASMLTAYTLLASQNESVKNYLKNEVIFIDPAINPDGRERHTQWANMYRSETLVSDNDDVEHNENWPRGRTNHYWFDLNRDWLLAINPESRGKLSWYHQWYPNVVTDFHEMGTNSSFFFEPMKTNGSKDPIMPSENYIELNNLFSEYFIKAADKIGSLYFTKEVFDGTYPGYGSSYGDLQGGLALLFEQASSRGHMQNTPYGDLTFAFTIRNQYVSSLATLQAAMENKTKLHKYQNFFFKSALTNSNSDKVKAYTFKQDSDQNRIKAFIDKLLIHKVKVYRNADKTGYIVPTKQAQYRMVQTFFETYEVYHDSVFYDASAWSLANFYNIKYQGENIMPNTGVEIMDANSILSLVKVVKSDYAYLLDWNDINCASALNYMQTKGLVLATSFKPFTIKIMDGKNYKANYGTLMLPVAKQKLNSDEIYNILKEVQDKYSVNIYSLNSGISTEGIDLGSGNVRVLQKPTPVLLIGEGTNSNEAGEIWHHFDQRLNMPLSKVMIHRFRQLDLNQYNTLILVSGNYASLDSIDVKKISDWVAQGNTLITIGTAVSWAIKVKLLKEKLIEAPKKEKPVVVERKPFDQAEELLGKESLGGAIFKTNIDITHPIGFGYTQNEIPVYKNNNVWLSPSENEYSTISKYTANPHLDGYISSKNLNEFMKNAASCVVSQIGQGRVILFADDPVFRGTLYSTDRMLTNAVFFGKLIRIPSRMINEEEKE
ncbi:MAG: zinc carboxypeptidase [Saprospiraceae bacterium]|nr:zinc carboxypeptidase [Saprospiraceae bacterium]